MGMQKPEAYRRWLLVVALGDSQEIAVALVRDGHDTASMAHMSDTVPKEECENETYPTRKSFPAAVPSATFVPPK